ncbi:MAG TPA: pitrilysin family protein [Thermoanaerobaculia bacterium]|nr:pitrilysin family protein [Thermoanaerobaculia bacterium]
MHCRPSALLLAGMLAAGSLSAAPAAPAADAAKAANTAETAKPKAEGAKTAAAKASASHAIFPYKVHETTLANGLKVIVIPYDSPGTVAYFTVVRAGARNEVEPGHSGFAHFFEHMMFRGTEKYSADNFNDLLKRMGADNNAFTTEDFTNFYTIGPSSSLPTIVDMESDRFKNLKYSEDAFKTEALAVLGEYNKSASSPGQPMEEKLHDLAYEKHTYKHTVIGFIADVKAMPGYYDYSRQFFARFYRPENVVVLVVGDVKPETVFALAKQYYGDWKPGYQEVKIEPEPPQTQKKEAHIDWPNPVRPQFVAGYHVPGFSTANVDSAALDILSQLLFSESAPLYQELVVQKQWVDGIEGGTDDHRDPTLFLVDGQVKSPDLIPKVLQTVDEYIDRLKKEPVNAKQLERIKSHLRYRFALSLNSPGAVASQAARSIALTGDVKAINQIYALYQKVTPADIQRVARQFFRPENETLITLSHPESAPAAAPGGGR